MRPGETNEASSWHPSENGATVGQTGSEQGVILEDDEHAAGARITLEHRDGKTAPFAITCGVYGWFMHTRFFSSADEARRDFERMKVELDRITGLLWKDERTPEQARHEVLQAISDFVDRFPT